MNGPVISIFFSLLIGSEFLFLSPVVEKTHSPDRPIHEKKNNIFCKGGEVQFIPPPKEQSFRQELSRVSEKKNAGRSSGKKAWDQRFRESEIHFQE